MLTIKESIKLEKLIRMYEKLSYSQLLDISAAALNRLKPLLLRMPQEVNAGLYFAAISSSAVGADGSISYKEIKFMNETLKKAYGADTDTSLSVLYSIIKGSKIRISDLIKEAKTTAAMCNVNENDILTLLSMYGEFGEKLANQLYDFANDDEQLDILTIVLCVLSVDGDIDHTETKFLKRLLD